VQSLGEVETVIRFFSKGFSGLKNDAPQIFKVVLNWNKACFSQKVIGNLPVAK
jgi:hypothetical protein